jgi:hypothetical protein
MGTHGSYTYFDLGLFKLTQWNCIKLLWDVMNIYIVENFEYTTTKRWNVVNALISSTN